MEATLKKKWVEALRSGKYTQGRGSLVRVIADDEYEYCCLGVLNEVAGRFQSYGLFDVDLERPIVVRCMDMNDQEMRSFPEIADWIEVNVPEN